MKKLSLTVLTVVVALCMALGITLMTNTATAKADPVAGTTPTLSATKYKLSSAKDGMLIATGIKDCEDVYEVGYTFDGEVTAVNNSKTNYYTSITSGGNTWTVEDLFDDTYTGMIVWEVDYSLANSFAFTAYAKVGARDGGNLVYDPLNETIVNGTERTVAAVPKTSFDFETASDLSYVSVAQSQAAPAIIDDSERVIGNPPYDGCGEHGNMSGDVLKVVGIGGGKGLGSIITFNLGKTVAAGSVVSFDIAITDMNVKDTCPTYVMVYVKDGADWDSVQSYKYDHVCGTYKHVSVTLSSATDKVIINCASGLLASNEGNLNTVEIYLDNVEVLETPRTSFDFESASDLSYILVTGNAGNPEVVAESSRVIGNPPYEGCGEHGSMTGDVLKVVRIGGLAGQGSIITFNLGKTVAAGSIVTFYIAIVEEADKDECNHIAKVYVKDGDWRSAYSYSHSCGTCKAVSLTLNNATDKIEINCASDQYTADGKNSAIIYIDQLNVIETPKTSFDFESASDLNYITIEGNKGVPEIIDESERIIGNPPYNGCGEHGDMSDNVLKVLGIGSNQGRGSTITFNLGKTVAAGSVVEFDIAIVDDGDKDNCSAYAMVYVKDGGSWRNPLQYNHTCGTCKHVSITLDNATDKIIINCTDRSGHADSYTNHSINLSTVEVYLDNLVVTEP